MVKRMRPVLAQLKERGVTGFIDCTPAYIGRDPRVLKRLAQETGLHIVTNTGYYGGAGDKFVPPARLRRNGRSARRPLGAGVGKWHRGYGCEAGFRRRLASMKSKANPPGFLRSMKSLCEPRRVRQNEPVWL